MADLCLEISILSFMPPRISLITPSYQQQRFLGECLRSVQEQAGVEVEHIVVDGGSIDGSREILNRASAGLAWWCCEPDRGQSHAINKGLQHATGDVFGWLNSDDLLLPDALWHVSRAFEADASLLVYGGRRLIRSEDGTHHVAPLDDPSDPIRLFIAPEVNQQSTFYRLNALRAVGGVDEELRYVMDLDLWWRVLFTFGTDHLRFDQIDLAVFRLHGESKTMTSTRSFRDETHVLLHGMAVATGQQDLANVFAMGLRTTVRPRPMPVRLEHAPLVRRMAAYFLLKWHHVIHDRWQFEMMRAFIRTLDPKESELETEQHGRLRSLQRQLGTYNWTTFRMRRKLQHLRG